MNYIVTFEETMIVHHEVTWIKGARIFEHIDEARDFLELMYSTNKGSFRYAHLWKADEIAHKVTATVEFGLSKD